MSSARVPQSLHLITLHFIIICYDDAMAIEDTSLTAAATCRFPGCVRPVAERAGDAGRRPGYCDDSAHTAVTAWRARRAQAGDAAGSDPDEAQPVTMAAVRAGVLRDELVRLAEQLAGQLDRAVAALQTITDPDEAMAQIEQAAAETGEKVAAAQAAQARAEAAARSAVADRQSADDAAGELQDRLADVEAELAATAEREQDLAGRLTETETQLSQATTRAEDAEAETARLAVELAAARKQADTQAAALEAAEERANDYQAAARKAEADSAAAVARAEEANKLLIDTSGKLDDLRDAKNAVEVRLAAAAQRADDAVARADAADKAKSEAETARWEAEKTVVRLTTRLENRQSEGELDPATGTSDR